MSRNGDRVLTLHPAGKNGVRIQRSKYVEMRRALLRVVPRSARGIPFAELARRVEPHLGAAYRPGDSVTWYVVAVKQDLEARGELELVPGARPQRLRRPA